MKKRISRLFLIAAALVLLTAIHASAYTYSIKHGEFSNSYCSSFIYEGITLGLQVELNDVELTPGTYTVTSSTPGVVSFNEDFTRITGVGVGETQLVVHYDSYELKKDLTVYEVPEMPYTIDGNKIVVNISEFDRTLDLFYKGNFHDPANDWMWRKGAWNAVGTYTVIGYPGETYSFMMRYWDDYLEDWVTVGPQVDITIPEAEPTEPTNPAPIEPTNPAPTEPTIPTPAEPAVSFSDVKADAYYYEPVMWAVKENITNGLTATSFGPDDTCTRAQVVTFLWRSAGSPRPNTSENPFGDVKQNAYYYDAVLWAVEKGITTGTSQTEFSPDASCTRAQVVTFLWRTAQCPSLSHVNNPFRDVAADYYIDAVLWAVEKGITNGMSETTFEPHTTCNRGQIVTFLYRYMN